MSIEAKEIRGGGNSSVSVTVKESRKNKKSTKGGGAAKPGRLASLDAFRGLTVLAMLLVNTKVPGAPTLDQLRHAGWHEGIHFADMVFPWFVFMMGMAVPFSAVAREKNCVPAGKYYFDIFRRATALVLLGVLINSSYASRPAFDFGVLQLIGFAYLGAALIYDLPQKARVATAVLLLLAHWGALRFLELPGHTAGVFTESHNLIRFMDKKFFGAVGLEGMLSVVPTTALAVIGTLVGDALRNKGRLPSRRAFVIMGAGAAMVAVGLLWSIDIPFNKPLWTASYVVFAAGWGAFGVGLFHYIIDVRGISKWAFPLLVLGMNALAAFVAPILFKIYILRGWDWLLADGSRIQLQEHIYNVYFHAFGISIGSWLYIATFIGAWWLILFQMYRKRIFLRV